MRLKLRVAGIRSHTFKPCWKRPFPRGTVSLRSYQARLVKYFLVAILHTMPGALSFLLSAEDPFRTAC